MIQAEDRTPRITRSNEINRLTFRIESTRRARDELIERIQSTVQNSNERLTELNQQIYQTLPAECESLLQMIPLVEKTIFKVTDPHNRMSPTSLNEWFETKLNRIFHQFHEDADRAAEIYHRERSGPQTDAAVAATAAATAAQQAFSHHQRELLQRFQTTEKNPEKLQELLESLRSRINQLEEEKDRLIEENNDLAFPIAEGQENLGHLRRLLNELTPLKEELQSLLRLQVSENCTCFEAAQFGLISVITNLINNGEIPDINVRDDRGFNMLHIAAYANQFVVVHFLLSRGADFMATDTQEYNTPMHWAARAGHANIISLLHRNAAGSNAFTRFFDSIFTRKGSEILNAGGGMCVERERKPDGTFELVGTPIQRTPLHVAAFHNRHAAIRRLLKLGADINAQTQSCNAEKTPLIETLGSLSSKIQQFFSSEIRPDEQARLRQELIDYLDTFHILLSRPEIDLRCRYLIPNQEGGLTIYHMAIELGIDTGSVGILNLLLEHPTKSSSVYVKEKRLFRELVRYAISFHPENDRYRPDVLYTLEKYRLEVLKQPREAFLAVENDLKTKFPAAANRDLGRTSPIDQFIVPILTNTPQIRSVVSTSFVIPSSALISIDDSHRAASSVPVPDSSAGTDLSASCSSHQPDFSVAEEMQPTHLRDSDSD